jgi:hypothetical protein
LPAWSVEHSEFFTGTQNQIYARHFRYFFRFELAAFSRLNRYKNSTTEQMIKKYSVLICVVISAVFIAIAASVYPGGSLPDENSVGFDWTKNFISNLFSEKAMNGSYNASRIWALIGMAFHALGYGIFFINMSKKIPSKHAATVLVIVGVANVLFNFLITTSLHDIMVTMSSTFTLIGLFYITVFVLKTKRHLLKIFCIICLLIFYYTLYVYGSGNWGLLAIMQKLAFFLSMILILVLEYFTQQEDFIQVKSVEQKYK